MTARAAAIIRPVVHKLLLQLFAASLAASVAPVAARADALDSGFWDSPWGKVKFEKEGSRFVGRLTDTGKACGLIRGDEVLRGQVEEELFTGEARVCYPGKCAEAEWALALALGAKSPARWLGGVIEPARGCAASPKGAFRLERAKVVSTAAMMDSNPVGKFRSKEAENSFTEARAARGAFDLRGALKALKQADAKEPDHPDVLLEMSDVYRQLKEPEKAREVLVKVAKKDKRYGNYNLACLEAQLGHREAALLHLNQAVAAGWAQYEATLGDPDLEPLRGTPEFETALAKIQKNADRERRGQKR